MRGILTIQSPEAEPELYELNKGQQFVSVTEDRRLILSEGTTPPPNCVFGLKWEKRICQWMLKREPDSPEIRLGNKMPSSRPLPFQPGVILECVGHQLTLRRELDVPTYNGVESPEIELGKSALVVGRTADSQGENRLDLDPENLLIASRQLEITPTESGGYAVANIGKGRGRIELNGENLPNHPVEFVFGDRLQIDAYLFEFTGRTLRRVDHLASGLLQGRALTRVVKDRDTGQPKVILRDVDIDIHPGEFVGILGGSGQGKSTLMKALCGIAPASSGSVFLNGRPAEVDTSGFGYVPQDDIVHPELTVEQAVWYSARLRLNLPDSILGRLVDATLESLGLDDPKLRGARISVISGGQRKRVSIATELLAKPPILFLDEPSSGLDPKTEADLMEQLQAFSRGGLTIICTTHVLQKAYILDKLCFIQGGRLVFIGNPSDAQAHFTEQRGASTWGFGRGQGSVASVGSAAGSVIGSTMGTAIGTSAMRRGTATQESLSEIYGLLEDSAVQEKTSPTSDESTIRRAQMPASAEQWEDAFDASSYAPIETPIEADDSAAASGRKGLGVGFLKTFRLLLARQRDILVADRIPIIGTWANRMRAKSGIIDKLCGWINSIPSNPAFLLGQAALIAIMVGWVTDDAVLQIFLCVVATLWFGCSNGSQQIVRELPIFHRERVTGQGLNVYLMSKVIFLSFITSLQAMVLFFVTLCSSHLLNPGDFEDERENFVDELVDRLKPIESILQPELVASPEEDNQSAVDFSAESTVSPLDFDVMGDLEDGEAVAEVSPPSEPNKIRIPTKEDWMVKSLTEAAWFFRLDENLLNSGWERDLDEHGAVIRTADDKPQVTPGIHLGRLLLFTVGLKIIALILTAITGVSLGLTISAFVQNDTQAAMWVPLILIPQILFGGFVVTVPEMTKPVRAFSSVIPSFAAERVMDVSNIFGQKVPKLTNQTKYPTFLTLDGEQEKIEWSENRIRDSGESKAVDRSETYDQISDFNTSWQNLAAIPSRIGEHKKDFDRVGTKKVKRDTVDQRRDVTYEKGTRFAHLAPAQIGLLTLGGWILATYGITLITLARKRGN